MVQEKELVNRMYIVKNGTLEIFIKIDNYYLCIERLFRGSILNHHAFIVDDINDAKIVCSD